MDDSLRRTIRDYYANPEYVRAAADHAISSRAKRLPVLEEYLPPKGLTVEVGCGAGVYSDLCPRYVGLDISLTALRELRARGGLGVCCDIANIPLRSGIAGAVLSFDALEHVYEPDRVLQEVSRILEPGGRAILRDVWLKTEKHGGWLPRELRKKLGNLGSRVMRLWRELTGDYDVAYSRISPDYSQVGGDHDAVSRIDAHSVYRFFRRRGFRSLNEHRNPIARITRLWTRHRHWVVVEKRPAAQR
ncbi:MAG: methyltransferase domain-containing protein [Myxococcota bacterium]